MKLTDTLLVPPAAEPVTVVEVKVSARIDADITEYDPIIPMHIAAAREQAEHETERCLLPQTWRAELDDWDASVTLSASPNAEITAVQYHNGTDWVTAANLYALLPVAGGKAVAVRTDEAVPALPAITGARVRIDYRAGYGDTLPKSVNSWIVAQCCHWLNHPEAATERALTSSPFLARLLDPLRTWG